MKKDGFVSMTLVYTFLILFLFLMLAVLHAYTQQNKYLQAIDSKINLTINTTFDDNYCPYPVGETFNYGFVNDFQTFVSACNGTYKIELWGAEGGSYNNKGGKGAYTSGNIKLEKDDTLYVYVGQSPDQSNCDNSGESQSFNGSTKGGCLAGGGATDVRLISGPWNDINSLISRIMVAAGGGGSYENTSVAGAAGGLQGYDSTDTSNPGIGGKQTSSSFGIGTNSASYGGGGYYGGNGGNLASAGGGSSFISGHIGSVAIVSDSSYTIRPRLDSNDNRCLEETNDIICSFHDSDKFFTNTVMIDGKGYSWTNTKNEKVNMPKPNDNIRVEGNTGNGYATITYIGEWR